MEHLFCLILSLSGLSACLPALCILFQWIFGFKSILLSSCKLPNFVYLLKGTLYIFFFFSFCPMRPKGKKLVSSLTDACGSTFLPLWFSVQEMKPSLMLFFPKTKLFSRNSYFWFFLLLQPEVFAQSKFTSGSSYNNKFKMSFSPNWKGQ